MAENFRGKGYATDAVISLCNLLFNEMNMHRIESVIIEYNLPSQALYKKCGFVLECVLRKAVYKSGAYRDQLMFALLQEDFFQSFLRKSASKKLYCIGVSYDFIWKENKNHRY